MKIQVDHRGTVFAIVYYFKFPTIMQTPKPTQGIFHQVMDRLDHAVIICDKEGRFTYWNDAAKNILGNYDEVKNDPTWVTQYGMFHMDEAKTPYREDEVPLIKALKGQTNKEVMFVTNENKPSGVFIEVSSSPVLDENENIVGGMAAFKDVTQSIKIDEFVLDLRKRLQQLSKLISVGFYSTFDNLLPDLGVE